MSIDLESIGITKEELQDRVIKQICEKFLTGIAMDEDGEYEVPTSFSNKLNKMIVDKVNKAVAGYFEKFVLPQVSTYIENLTLQETNKWGEKTGSKLTFIECLVQKAEAYIQEKVDYRGNSKSQASSYSWTGTQTRISHMIHEHLHYRIEEAIKAAIRNANSVIVEGIENTVKIKLSEIADKLQVSVKTK